MEGCREGWREGEERRGMEDGRDGWWEKRGREGGMEWHKMNDSDIVLWKAG